MDQPAIDYVLTIVQLLAKGVDNRRLSPMKVNILNQNIEALTNYDSDEFICKFLAMVKNATGVLTPNVGGKANALAIRSQSSNLPQAPVPSQNLNPDILMMKPAEDWYCCDAADLLRTPKIRR